MTIFKLFFTPRGSNVPLSLSMSENILDLKEIVTQKRGEGIAIDNFMIFDENLDLIAKFDRSAELIQWIPEFSEAVHPSLRGIPKPYNKGLLAPDLNKREGAFDEGLCKIRDEAPAASSADPLGAAIYKILEQSTSDKDFRDAIIANYSELTAGFASLGLNLSSLAAAGVSFQIDDEVAG